MAAVDMPQSFDRPCVKCPCLSQTSTPATLPLTPQACSLEAVEDRLRSWGVPFVQNVFFEDGVRVGQVSAATAACCTNTP